VPAGYCVEILEDGTEHLVESWPDSPCSEPIEDDEDDAWQEGGARWAAQEQGAS
jgi:hypothetical protein